MTPMPSTNVRTLPVRDPLEELPELVARAWRRRLSIVAGMEGFFDRVTYVHESLTWTFELAHVEVITPPQFAAMQRRLRAMLQDDLGAITEGDVLSARSLPDE
jgi:hypothetical protein